MEIRRFNDVEAFAAQAVPQLVTREAERNLELGILDAIRAGRYRDHAPLLATIEDEGQVRGVAMRTPPHGLLLSSSLPPGGAAFVAEWLITSEDPVAAIPGVQAEVAVAAAFVAEWHRRGGRPMAIHRDERIYRLTGVRAHRPAPPGAMRSIRTSDRALIVDWFRAFAVEANEPDSIDSELAVDRLLARNSDSLGLYLWELDGQPRSMAGHSGPTPHGMRVGPVYTPPAERRRGYAGALVASLSQRLLDGGREFCFLFTDLSNPTSNHVYQQIGYEAVCDVAQWRVVTTYGARC